MLKAFSNVEFISETNQQLISALQNRTNGNYWVLFGDVFSTYVRTPSLFHTTVKIDLIVGLGPTTEELLFYLY